MSVIDNGTFDTAVRKKLLFKECWEEKKTVWPSCCPRQYFTSASVSLWAYYTPLSQGTAVQENIEEKHAAVICLSSPFVSSSTVRAVYSPSPPPCPTRRCSFRSDKETTVHYSVLQLAIVLFMQTQGHCLQPGFEPPYLGEHSRDCSKTSGSGLS